MKIISWNINGFNSIVSKGFYGLIKEIDADIICLQEIRANEVTLPFDFGYNSYFSFSNRKGYSGTAIFSRIKAKSIERAIGLKRFDDEGRFLRLDFPKFILINVYMPHGNRDKRDLDYKLLSYSRLLDYLKKIKDRKIILLGDFNIAHQDIDLANPKENKNNIMFGSEERKMLDFIIVSFLDSFRDLNPNAQKFSWWPYYNDLRERNVGWRLDYIFMSRSLSSDLLSSDLLSDVMGSDHCPAMVEANL